MTGIGVLGKVVAGLLKAPLRAYQLVLSPVLPMSCRFEPSCSNYAIQALDRHGPIGGAGLALWRVLRCQPWGGCGHDPVPERLRLPRRWRP